MDIANAMATEASDKTKILNSLVLPRAGTKVLQQEAPTTHESNLFELWNSFLSDFFIFSSHLLTESTHYLLQADVRNMKSQTEIRQFPLKS